MAKVITYDPVWNRIHAKGGTEMDPITFADLYTADQGGGWGVVHDYGNNTYHLDARLYLGDGTTSTYFKDTNKIIVFTAVITGNTIDLIYVYSQAHLQLGELVNEVTKETYHGCVVQSMISGISSFLFRSGSTNTYRRLYGCTIISPNVYNKNIQIYCRDNTRLWHCSFVNYVYPYIVGDADIHRCTVQGGSDSIKSKGFEAQLGSPTIDDYVGLNLRWAASCLAKNYDIKISRLKAINDYGVAVQGNHNKDMFRFS